eukprot:2793754-Prymnesium_polylepis.1
MRGGRRGRGAAKRRSGWDPGAHLWTVPRLKRNVSDIELLCTWRTVGISGGEATAGSAVTHEIKTLNKIFP